MNEGPPFSGVNVVLVMAYGSLVFVLLFIFLKRQITRFVMKSQRRPLTPVGQNAPQELREKIGGLLFEEFSKCREPRLLSHHDVRLKHNGLNACNYLYRMQALDAIKDADIAAPDVASSPSTRSGSCYRNYLLVLRDSNTLIKISDSSLLDRLLTGYDNARHGTGVFGEAEFLKYKADMAELAANIKAHSSSSSSSSSSMNQQHQAASKALMSSTDPFTASSYQVTCRRNKRLKHYLELKNFKDSCNTLKSTTRNFGQSHDKLDIDIELALCCGVDSADDYSILK